MERSQQIVCKVEPSPRNSGITLRVINQVVHVRVNPRVDKATMMKFVQSKKPWILQEIARQEPYRIAPDKTIRICGQKYTVKKDTHCSLDEEAKIFYCSFQPEDFDRFVCSTASKWLKERVVQIAAKEKIPLISVNFKTYASKWGSYKNNGTMRLNANLIFYPLQSADAVIYHELAHSKHMNHSAQFYRFLYSMYPQYDYWDNMLKEPTPFLPPETEKSK